MVKDMDKVKNFDYNGQVVFEGLYLYGKRWNGKEYVYDYHSQSVSEFEYLCGKKHNV